MIDLYFKPEYAEIYKDIDGPSHTFEFKCPYGEIRNTFIQKKIKWTIGGKIYYDISTPYGYGGPLILNSTSVEKLMDEYKVAFYNYCIEHNIIAEFVRFHLFDNVDAREHYYGETLHLLDDVVVDTKGSFDEIWMRYDHKVRKNVKKAVENNLEIIIEQSTLHLNGFLDIYYKTMERNNANDYYYFKREYFESFQKLMPNNFCYFHVMKDGTMISTELVLCSEKYAYSFLGGTDNNYYDLRPNDFLKNEIIKWCNQTGREFFILGGGYHKDDGIYKYKRSFTKMPDVPYYVGRAIFNHDIYNQIVERRKAEDADFNVSSTYFPLYRAPKE